MEKADNDSAYMTVAALKLLDFYNRYSPHAYVDCSRVYIRHSKPQRTYVLPEGYLELLEQERCSPLTVKIYRAYFGDFVEYHKGRSIDHLKMADINEYILYLVNEKKISVSRQNMRVNAIRFYYEQVKDDKRQYYDDITRAREYKTLLEALDRDEIRRILSCLTNRKHHCMISLIYSAGLGKGKLLNLTPQGIVNERMLVRIMGKGKKCRYSLLSEKMLHELREYSKEYHPKRWLFEDNTPGEQYSASALVKVLEEATQHAGIKHRVHIHILCHSFATHPLEQGIDLRTVQESLGHSNMRAMSIYLHVADARKSSIPNPLGSLDDLQSIATKDQETHPSSVGYQNERYQTSVFTNNISCNMRGVIILYVSFLLSPYTFAQNYKETIQAEIDAVDKMPLRIAYLVPLDSLGKVIENECMKFDQIHSYRILDDGQTKNANILFTIYFDDDNSIRKIFEQWADGGALHNVAYCDPNGRLIYGVYNGGDETHGKLYADTPGFYIEYFPEENECNDCLEAYLSLSTKYMEAQYNIILQSPPNAKRTIFTPQVGNDAILCSSYIYSLPNGEKATKDEDDIVVNFGMPVVVSNLTNDWCKTNSIFNAPIGYILIQDIEIIK